MTEIILHCQKVFRAVDLRAATQSQYAVYSSQHKHQI